MKDKVVNRVIAQYKERSRLGINKYNTTLEDNTTDDFLKHLQEELMDATLYIQKLRDTLNGEGYTRIEDLIDREIIKIPTPPEVGESPVWNPRPIYKNKKPRYKGKGKRK